MNYASMLSLISRLHSELKLQMASRDKQSVDRSARTASLSLAAADTSLSLSQSLIYDCTAAIKDLRIACHLPVACDTMRYHILYDHVRCIENYAQCCTIMHNTRWKLTASLLYSSWPKQKVNEKNKLKTLICDVQNLWSHELKTTTRELTPATYDLPKQQFCRRMSSTFVEVRFELISKSENSFISCSVHIIAHPLAAIFIVGLHLQVPRIKNRKFEHFTFAQDRLLK